MSFQFKLYTISFLFYKLMLLIGYNIVIQYVKEVGAVWKHA